MKDDVLITNIQRFSIHDGPGIRTTVFFKGCSVHCPWCANPENINMRIEKCVDGCCIKEYGYYTSNDELFKILMRDKVFYENDGGVTLSGGEALLQIKKVEPLLQKLKQEKIGICLETALFIPTELLEIAIKYIDLYYVDIKIMEQERCNTIIGGNIILYKKNVKFLIDHNKKIIFRMPLINLYTSDINNIVLISEFLKSIDVHEIQLLCEHHLGYEKSKNLGMKVPDLKGLDIELAEQCQNEFEIRGISTVLSRI